MPDNQEEREKDINLPNEYFDVSVQDLNTQIGEDYNISSSDAVLMEDPELSPVPGEVNEKEPLVAEQQTGEPKESLNSSQAPLSKNADDLQQDEQIKNEVDLQGKQTQEGQIKDTQFAKQINDIDSNISNLKKQLDLIKNTPSSENFSTLNSETINKILQKNTTETDLFNSNLSQTNVLQDNNNIVEVITKPNTNNKIVNEFVKKIEELNVRKQTLINQTSQNNTTIQQDSGFVPNLAPVEEEKKDQIKKAVLTEKMLGETPKLVTDNDGSPVVINERQETLKRAIQEHGGIDKAKKDSISNQNFISEIFNNSDDLSNNTSTSDIFNKNDNVSNSTSNINQIFNSEELFNSYSEEKQDQIRDVYGEIEKNTQKTSSEMSKLVKEVASLSNVVSKGFASFSNDMNSFFVKQNTIVNMVKNNNAYQDEGSNSAVMSAPERNIIPSEIRDSKPLARDFPSNFDLNDFKGNNLR